MIAADTSSLVAYFTGAVGVDVERIGAALAAGNLVLPPVVVTELLSDVAAAERIDAEISSIQTLDLTEGYWARAGRMRRTLRRHGLKAKVADALITQSCLDHDVALITRDRDFRHFAKHCGLKLA